MTDQHARTTTHDIGQLAIDYLHAVRDGDNDRARRASVRLSSLPPTELAVALTEDAARLAFWVNLYNGAVLQQPEHPLGSWLQRSAFFRQRVLRIAGRPMSLDSIEHGILRRSRWRVSLGFATNPRPSAFERAHRVGRFDPRIHFALNCAAASCPPIAAYRSDLIDGQLDLATRSYLSSEITLETGQITVPRTFLWFLGDFGGPPGLRRFLRAHGIDGAGRAIRFASYDWTPRPGRWVPSSDRDRE